jgi:hypothetical protein
MMRTGFAGILMSALLLSSFGVAQQAPSCESGETPNASAKHSIKLTWEASKARSSKQENQAVGYIIYRSDSAHCEGSSKHCAAINHVLIKGTSCIDDSVRSGRSYSYRAQAVSANAVRSGFSNEAKATVP